MQGFFKLGAFVTESKFFLGAVASCSQHLLVDTLKYCSLTTDKNLIQDMKK